MSDRSGASVTPQDAPAAGTGPEAALTRRRGEPLTVAAVALAASIVAWLRLTPVTRDTLWAEDGRVFLWDAFPTSGGSTLLRPYDGYLHLVPRAVAEAVSALLPPQDYAVVITATACLIAGGTACVVYVCASAVTRSRVLRIAFAAITVVTPALPLEVLGNLANAHWFGLWLMPWLLLYRPRTWAGGTTLGVVSLACALTEIQTVFFLPLVIWRWRSRRGWPVRFGLLLGIATQAAALAGADRPGRTGAFPSITEVTQGFLVDAVGSLWAGSSRAIAWTLTTFGWAALAIGVVLAGVAVFVVLRRGDATQRLAALVFSAASILAWTAAMYANRPDVSWDLPAAGEPDGLAMLRYGVIPSMFLLATLVLALAVLPHRRIVYVTAALCALPLVFASVTTFVPSVTGRSAGPGWSEQIEGARQACLADPAARYQELPIAPPGWATRVPCHVLEGGP